MGDVVNLRRFRKGKAREDAAKTADANRIAFGRSKSERNLSAAERDLETRRLEGHRRPVREDEPPR